MGNIILLPVEPMGSKSLDEYVRYLANVQAMNQDELTSLLEGRISSINIREIAGFLVDLLTLKHKSGLVGMSAADPTNPEAVRFWSGGADPLVAPWRVLQKGSFYALDAFLKGHIDAESGTIGGFTITLDKLSGAGIIEGGTIRSAESGARIEIINGTITVYNSADHIAIQIDCTTSPPKMNFHDADGVLKGSLYYSGGSLLLAADGGLSITDLISMVISAPIVNAGGNWSFTNIITGSITGHAASADYADHAGTAAAADNLAPSGNIAWGQVLKSGSNIADLAVKNISSLTDDSLHRTVTDTEKTNWNNAKTTADAALPKTGGTVTDKIEVTNGSYRVLMLPEGYFANNADNNETGETWNRLNTATGASLMGIDLGTGKPVVYYAPAGSNPITWNGPHEILTSETIKRGVGIPEGIVAAPVGTLYLRSDGGASSTLYVKESGTGPTGWVAK